MEYSRLAEDIVHVLESCQCLFESNIAAFTFIVVILREHNMSVISSYNYRFFESQKLNSR